ncbi:MAG: translation elongation factor 4 [Actinobacteria bacterium]|nr:translation elongation factor 4 [Actinomycetota bacterium]MCL6105025.1 translation elongation factor 4 [Actinomycetota bacterium]
MIPIQSLRNFSIISHIDHGKSTLSDRILELTAAVDPRDMREQFLDTMDLERERGITIKAQCVRVSWKGTVLNLIDTPGHVDFGYEVSRSLAACEGAVLLVDASQGIQAQTVATCYQALEHNLEIVAAVNKIDLPQSDPDLCAEELAQLLGIEESQVLRISAKTGQGVAELLDAVVKQIPPPNGDPDESLQALVFDSSYDPYRGVVSFIRVANGTLRAKSRIKLMQAATYHEVEELGVHTPYTTKVEALGPGEVGYIFAGIKDVAEARSGETITDAKNPAADFLPGYRRPKPMVFCGLYPTDADQLSLLREALDKLRLSDASFVYEPETSGALGFGFRCGFLGLLHSDITRERLEREFGLSLVTTAPSVAYKVYLKGSSSSTDNVVTVDNPTALPDPEYIDHIEEPWLVATIVTPTEYLGSIMQLCNERRGRMNKMNYLSSKRVELVYEMPLSEVILDFFDLLKSSTRGYATFDYEPFRYETSNLVKVDLLINGVVVDAFSAIIYRSKADAYGRGTVEKLKKLIPRQLFDVPIQAAVGGRIIARETIRAKRKDVIAKCYGGDITRKRKLLEKQKEGKKRMKSIGRVEMPQEVFIQAIRN